MKASNRGYALLSVLAVVTALLVAGVATITLVREQLHFTADQTVAQSAYYVAEAGIQRGIAQLDNDAATAATAGYTYPTISPVSFGGGTYTVTVAQDSLYAGNLSRKLITSTGTLHGQQATLVAHAFVQPPMTACAADPCCGNLMVANRDATLQYSVLSALASLFNGNIFSGRDTTFQTTVAALFGATGNVSTARDFWSKSGIVGLGSITGNLNRGGTYHNDSFLGLTGFRFSNGGGTGVTPALASPSLPAPDWDSAKKDSHTVIVNQSNYSTVAPGSSWAGGTGGTWTVSTFSLNDATRYYVDGTANVTGLQLLGNRSAEIWSPVAINVGSFSVVSALSAQSLTLVTKGSIVVGGALGSGLTSLANTTNILAYSTGGSTQVDAGVNGLNGTRACVIAGGAGASGDATFKVLAAVASTLRAIR